MVNTKEDFERLVENIKEQSWYRKPLAFAIARVDKGVLKNQTLQAVYPAINWNENEKSAAIFLSAIKGSFPSADFSKSEAVFPLSDDFLTFCIKCYKPFYEEKEKHKNLQVVSTLASLPIDSGLSADDFRVIFIFEDEKPQSVESAYLKLYAKHSKKVEDVNLDDIENLLVNCAWIDNKPIELEWLRQNEVLLKIADKYPRVDYVGKYARALQHIIPSDDETSCKASLLK